MDTAAHAPGFAFGAFVHLTDSDGAFHAYQPGDPVPDWALPLVGEHVLTPWPPPVTPSDDLAPTVGPFTSEPPTSGPGSNWAAWSAYARDQGVEVTHTMSRQQIIDACRAARPR